MKFFRIKNWERFQHYDKRNPPWIKVYNELLEDYEFNSMKESTQLNLLKIWFQLQILHLLNLVLSMT